MQRIYKSTSFCKRLDLFLDSCKDCEPCESTEKRAILKSWDQNTANLQINELLWTVRPIFGRLARIASFASLQRNALYYKLVTRMERIYKSTSFCTRLDLFLDCCKSCEPCESTQKRAILKTGDENAANLQINELLHTVRPFFGFLQGLRALRVYRETRYIEIFGPEYSESTNQRAFANGLTFFWIPASLASPASLHRNALY